MLKRLKYFLSVTLTLLILVSQLSSTSGVSAHQNSDFVQRRGNTLKLHGKQFRFAGASNYYLMYKSQLIASFVFAYSQYNTSKAFSFISHKNNKT